MTKTVTLKVQHFSTVAPKDVVPLRSDASALEAFLGSPRVPRVGVYCGETIGRTRAGDV
jgi:hypothetical protein